MSNVRIGRVAGVEVAVHWSVVVIALLLTWTLASSYLPLLAPHERTATYWGAGLVGALLLLASLFAHELAHAVVARREDVEVESMSFWMLGGIARLRGDAPNAGAEFRIAAVGPGVSLALGMGFGLAAAALWAIGANPLVTGVAWSLALINVSLAIFNLLPGSPLDGGRILTAAIWRRQGDRVRASMTASRVGQTIGFVLCGLAALAVLGGDAIGGLWTLLIAGFLILAARAEYAASAAERLLGALRAMDVMSTPVETGRDTLTVEEFVNAHVLHGHYSSYPLVRADRSLTGLVTLQQIRALPRAMWPTTTIGQIAVPIDRVRVCLPTDQATSIQGTPETGGRALVVDRGDLVGIISPADLTHAMQARAVVEGLPVR